MKNAKLQALGVSVPERRHNPDRPEMATDEVVRVTYLDLCSKLANTL